MPEGFGVFRAFERGVHHHIRAIKTERERHDTTYPWEVRE